MNLPLLRRVLRKLAVLFEMMQIVDRNISDGGFSDNEANEIFYVFDTNIIQMFLEPYRNPQYAEIFHSPAWGEDFRDYQRANMQACLLIGEYLFSGKLPGQRPKDPDSERGYWYMSPEHYKELAGEHGQIAWLDKRIQENIDRLSNDEAFQLETAAFQRELQAILDTEPADREQTVRLARRQGESEAQLRELRNLPQDAYADRAAAIKARELCRVLASDDVFEPVDQLRRYRRKEIIGHLRSVELAFSPDRAAAEEIAAETIEWDEALRATIARRPTFTRTHKARENDTKTLALLDWIARKRLKPNQRIVLVTGDRALYDTYRERLNLEQMKARPDERPFLLRSVVQYAPLFNPSSAGSSVADKEDSFAHVRAALEAAAVAFSLKQLVSNASLSGARDHLILAAQRPIRREEDVLWIHAFPGLLAEETLHEQDGQLSALAQPMQRVEKLMLGAYPNLVARRLEDRARRDAFLLSVSADGKGLAEALQASLEEASTHAFLISLPWMPQYVAELLRRSRKSDGSLPRLLIGVRLSFPKVRAEAEDAEELLNRKQILDRLTAEDCELEALLYRLTKVPARIFALAALLAFGVEDWETAARYTDLAAAASERDDWQGDAATKRDHFELLYMKATSLRFMLSNRIPDSANTYQDQWALWLAESERALGDCISHHRDEEELSREMRAISERAAIRLAYCEWFAFGGLWETRIGAAGEATTMTALAAAIADLNDCHLKLAAAEERANDPERPDHHLSKDTLYWARMQFEINTAAAQLVLQQLDHALGARQHMAIGKLLKSLPEPEQWPDVTGLKANPMSQAYVLAASSRWKELAALETKSLTLPLDQIVIKGLKDMGRRAAAQ
jgi:hypothetical protein